ncbi:UNVERIFIED_CONTAM: Allantoinase [Sesamum radiatum]|uniref:Allantoinase n=1 Tax=Sesamum radiatum TaxID=300843 RepID=A0AAW2T1U3_SESRA
MKVEVKGGKIKSVVEGDDWRANTWSKQVIDYGEAVIMPGLIDVHAHLDDPGRTEWEGFPSGTRAAAAGGITTLIDMPLNSFPSTVSEETLKLKIKAAQERIFVDVGFWGGLVPENAFNATSLERLLEAGALGLKSFMCPSGINDFPMTNSSHIKEGLSVLAKYKRPLLVHAEIQPEAEDDIAGNPRSYSTYLKEEAAIKELLTVTKDTRPGGSSEGAEEIPDGDTRFKCAPPIRDADNKEKLWTALMFVLPVTWSYGRKYGISLHQLVSWWSEKPAKLAGQDLKNISAYMGSKLFGKVFMLDGSTDGLAAVGNNALGLCSQSWL